MRTKQIGHYSNTNQTGAELVDDLNYNVERKLFQGGMWKKVASVARSLHRVSEGAQSLIADSGGNKLLKIMAVSADCSVSREAGAI